MITLRDGISFWMWLYVGLLLAAPIIFSCSPSPETGSGAEVDYDPPIISPAYPKDRGPTLHLDEGHNNRHLYGGLGDFLAFREVLSKDGYQVVSSKERFTPLSLQGIRILVISLPQDERNLGPPWRNPTYSAFDRLEIDALEDWVKVGGSLFLIVDHHPFAGASGKLAQEFGFTLFNGHAEDTSGELQDIFRIDDRTLASNPITKGRVRSEQVSSVKTFGGAAMGIPEDASPILLFDADWVQYLPDTAWDFTGIEPESIEGLSQGAYKEYGSGKVVVFGDGNMFSAQIDEDGEIAGFIDPEAEQNCQLLLNIIHYLDGISG